MACRHCRREQVLFPKAGFETVAELGGALLLLVADVVGGGVLLASAGAGFAYFLVVVVDVVTVRTKA